MTVTRTNEIPMVSGWIYSRLAEDAALQALAASQGMSLPDRIWEYHAPESLTGWYIRYQRMEAGDVRGLGNHRFMTRLRYLIVVVDRGADWDHEAIANRIDTLFGGVGPLPVADPPGWIESSARIEPFDMPETVGGVQYRHLGGIYEIAATAGE
jgi:hypothetical protein